MDRPSARFSLLFLQYRRADGEAAINALAKWREGEVIAEAVSSPNDDVWARAALALFLTETGMRTRRFGYYSDYSPQWILDRSWGLDQNYEVYSYRAYSIISDLTRIASRKNDEKLLTFCTRWYVNAVSYSVRFRTPSLIGLRDMADHVIGDRAEIRLLIGSIQESLMGPGQETATAVCGHAIYGPDGCVPDPHQLPDTPTQQALYLLQHAVKKDPNLAEAQLRLGHALYLANRVRDARPYLAEGLRLAEEQHLGYIAYMADLFLGNADEHDGNYEGAITRFREAVAMSPGAHIANVALGEALLKFGDRSGWAEAARMFDDEDQAHPKSLDPWFFYRFAQYWHVVPGLRELREMVRAGS